MRTRKLLSALVLALVLTGTAAGSARAFRGDYPTEPVPTPPSNEGPCRGGRAC